MRGGDGTGGTARRLKRTAAEAQSGGGEDAGNDNMLGTSDDGEGDVGLEPPPKKKKKKKKN